MRYRSYPVLTVQFFLIIHSDELEMSEWGWQKLLPEQRGLHGDTKDVLFRDCARILGDAFRGRLMKISKRPQRVSPVSYSSAFAEIAVAYNMLCDQSPELINESDIPSNYIGHVG